jgi:SRSO17 transposase
MEDSKRLAGARVPERVKFQTKPEQALEMIQNATEAGVPYKWVTADTVYGDSPQLREWLEANRKWYVMCVSSNDGIWKDNKETTVLGAMKSLQSDGWQKASCGEGTKGSRIYEWQTVEIAMDWREIALRDETDEWKRVLLVRRSVSDATDMQGYMCYAPVGTTDDELIGVAGTRWTVVDLCQYDGHENEEIYTSATIRTYKYNN